jgi:hypothetical protein
MRIYNGWAPHICGGKEAEAERQKSLDFIDRQWMRVDGWDKLPDPLRRREGYGDALEAFLWGMEWLENGHASCTMYADQWVGVSAEGKVHSQEVSTFIQGDTFLLAMAETYRFWRDLSDDASKLETLEEVEKPPGYKESPTKLLVSQLETALRFYADPDTYFAIAFLPDPPCGDFMDDFEELDGDLGHPGGGSWIKPGKRARQALTGRLAGVRTE